MASTAVLARLLTPREFGIYAVVNALTLVIAASFQEFGGANYLIQKQSLSTRNIQTAFTITFCLSGLIGLILVLVSYPLALIFGQEGLREGIAVSALNIICSPFSVTMSALFRRNLEFGKLAICNLCGNAVVALVSIVLAVMHYSFMAPIWGMVAGTIVVTGLAIMLQKDVRIFWPSLTGYLDVVRFGLYSSGVVIINVFYSLAPQLFLARILDFTAVGLYSRAVSITQVFDKIVIQVLGPVIMPAILSRTREDGDLKRIYLDTVQLLAAVQWPFLTFIAIMAQPIVLIWLGPAWAEIIPLVRILCIASLSLFAACLTYPVLVAVGSVRDALLSSLISLPPSLLLMFFASFFGVEAVAASALVTLPFQAAVALWFVGRHLAIKPSDLFRATQSSGFVTLLTSLGALTFAAMVQLGIVGPVLGLALAGASAATGWWLGLVLTSHPLLARLSVIADGRMAWFRVFFSRPKKIHHI